MAVPSIMTAEEYHKIFRSTSEEENSHIHPESSEMKVEEIDSDREVEEEAE